MRAKSSKQRCPALCIFGRRVKENLCYSNVSRRWVWGRSPQKLSDFFEKSSYFNVIGIRFARVLSYLKELDFNIKKPIEKINLLNPTFTCNLSTKHV